MRKGFTLLELMVAALLMGMLLTILTMIFNQSSIAWTTGTASVTSLGGVRQDITRSALLADNALMTDGNLQGLKVVTIWNQGNSSGTMGANTGAGNILRTDTDGRTLDKEGIVGNKVMLDSSSRGDYAVTLGSGTVAGRDTYIVGVTSNGPDREPETWDDISTYPEDQL